MMHRRFEFVGGSSAKFWEVRVEGCEILIRFGRLGTDGQQQTLVFPSPAKATSEAEKRAGQKLDKGYVECAVV